MSIWEKFKAWFDRTFDYNNDGIANLLDVRDVKEDVVEKVEEVKTETKRRVRRVKQEIDDVKAAAKDVVEQTKDVVDAAKGKPRRGRKPKAKTAKKTTK